MAPPCFILQQRNGNGLRSVPPCLPFPSDPCTGAPQVAARGIALWIDSERDRHSRGLRSDQLGVVPRTFHAGIARTRRALTSRTCNEPRRPAVTDYRAQLRQLRPYLKKHASRANDKDLCKSPNRVDRLCFLGLSRSPNARVTARLPKLRDYRKRSRGAPTSGCSVTTRPLASRGCRWRARHPFAPVSMLDRYLARVDPSFGRTVCCVYRPAAIIVLPPPPPPATPQQCGSVNKR